MRNRTSISKGDKYGYLTLTGISRVKNNAIQVEYTCKCGSTGWARLTRIKMGYTKSCGCLVALLSRERTKKHGLSHTLLYYVWKSMINRCYNEKDTSFVNYGIKGVLVCDEWKKDFMSFYGWALGNWYKKGLELDKDILYKQKFSNAATGKIYSPEFCCFVSKKRNLRHTSLCKLIDYRGVIKNLSEWCEELKITYGTVNGRLNKGWDIEKAFETPIRKFNKNKNDVITS